MNFTIGQSFLLVMSVSKKRLLAFGANKMLNVPVLAKSSDHTFLDGSAARAADGNAHLVVTPQTVQFSLHFSGVRCQLHPARVAVEMVRMISFTSEFNVSFIDDGMAFVADVLSAGRGFLPRVALVAQSSASVLDESLVSQGVMATLATETVWVPVVVHGFDDTAYDELAASSAARREQHVEVVLAVLPSFELVENSFRERLEALDTHKTLLVPYFTSGVDNLLLRFKSFAATGAKHASHGHGYARHENVFWAHFSMKETERLVK